MKNQGKGNIGKYINLILLCLLFTFGSACEQKTDNEPTPPDGDGNGVFDFDHGIIPTTFNCYTSGHFEINFQPIIEDDYEGFNRLWFELKKDGQVYRSNYVEFSSSDESMQQLEWGGSLPTGEYQMRGILQNIQLNSTCADKVCAEETKHLGEIYITGFTNPSKVMEIEYFCQDSDTGIIDRYDVFLSPNTEEYMDIAFNIANTRDSVIIYSTDEPPELIRDTITAVEEYIYSLKDWPEHMFLCGVKGFKDRNGNFLVNYIGFTPQRDPFNFTPNCSTGSLVAVKACIDIVANKYKIDYNDFVTATTIHELGWQRAISYFDSHESKFCIMNVGLVVDTSEVAYNRYSNPHFCNGCITKIKNVNW